MHISDSANGEYKLVVYQYADPVPSQGTSADCVDNPQGVTKSDNFKVGAIVPPTVAKTQDSPAIDGGRAHWKITITNTQTNNGVVTGFVVTDTGAQLDAITGTPAPAAGACGSLPDTASPFTCDVAADSTLVLHVSKPLPAPTSYNVCEGTTIDNTASAALATGSPITVTHTNTVITIPPVIGGECATTRTIRIQKVSTSLNHGNATFTGTLVPGGTDTTFSVSLNTGAQNQFSLPQTRTVSTAEQTVTEDGLPAGWTLNGYSVAPDTQQSCSGTETYTTAASATVPPGTGSFLVCIKNTPRFLSVCKNFEDNGDATIRTFAFKFDVNIDGVHTPYTVTDTEGGANACQSLIPIPGGPTADVTVTELTDRPVGWLGDAPTYPKNNFDFGGAVAHPGTVYQSPTLIFFNREATSVPSLAKSSGSYNTSNDTATWTITIDNTGANSVSQSVVVTDAGATLTSTNPVDACGGLPDADGTFDCSVAANATLTLTVTKVIGQACAAGSVTNTASATIAGVAITNSPVTSSPALTIPADESLCSLPVLSKSSGSFSAASDTATWTVTVDNSGANAIGRDVVITDSGATMTAVSGGNCAGTLPDTDGTFNCTVAAGATLNITVTKVIAQTCGPQEATNTASATVGGAAIQNSPVISSPALVIPADTSLCPVPGINIQKTPDPQTIVVGGTASFTITVTNTGNVTLTNVSVSDALAPGCGRTAAEFDVLDPGTFDAGDVVTYSCSLANVSAGFTNSATATGTPPNGPDVTSTDTAVVLVQAPSIGIQKTPDAQTILVGGTATFTITVTNTGNVTLTNVSVSDAQAPGCARSAAEFDALDPGAFDAGDVVTYNCTLANVQASFVNSATATGTPPTGPAVTATDTAAVTVQIPATPPVVITTPVVISTPVVITTPVPPTATPVRPTATPVPPTKTTVVDVVAGEKTPGASSTPIAPSTGTGTAGTASPLSGFLALIGIMFLGSGLALIASGRRKTRE